MLSWCREDVLDRGSTQYAVGKIREMNLLNETISLWSRQGETQRSLERIVGCFGLDWVALGKVIGKASQEMWSLPEKVAWHAQKHFLATLEFGEEREEMSMSIWHYLGA